MEIINFRINIHHTLIIVKVYIIVSKNCLQSSEIGTQKTDIYVVVYCVKVTDQANFLDVHWHIIMVLMVISREPHRNTLKLQDHLTNTILTGREVNNVDYQISIGIMQLLEAGNSQVFTNYTEIDYFDCIIAPHSS